MDLVRKHPSTQAMTIFLDGRHRLQRSEDDTEVLCIQVGELACDRIYWKHSCATLIS